MSPERIKCPHCGFNAKQMRSNGQSLALFCLHCVEVYFLDYRSGINSYQQDSIESFLRDLRSKFSASIADEKISGDFIFLRCVNCEKQSIWVNNELVYPEANNVDDPNEDLPDKVQDIYLEAAKVSDASPRASAALLRLALQELLNELMAKGDNLKDAIEDLAETESDPTIAKALETVRITGNHAAHPGKIDFNDKPEMALGLFKLINYIAGRVISDKKDVEEMHARLPDGVKGASDKRSENQ